MLNSNQLEAVNHINWPLLINAWAWSWKTHTIIERMISLIVNKHARPEEIFAVTFTNKAAKEMIERIQKRITVENIIWTPMLWTFHGIAARYLRDYAPYLWYKKWFSILEDNDCTKIIKSIMKEFNIDPLIADHTFLKEKIDKIKNYWIKIDYLEKEIKKDMDRLIVDFYKEYIKRLFEENAMDFNDLLLNFLEILEIDTVLAKFHKQFKFFFVDEYQDTNMIQYKIIKILASKTRNLCVIWDDYQSIYSFRNADMKNIINFTKDYPEAKVIKLEENYRSTQNIINAANNIISNNTIKLEKNLFTNKEEWNPIYIYNANTYYNESDFIVQEIKKSWDYKKWAILYRNNYLSRFLEESLIRNKIPYRIFWWLSFVERMEVKDLMSYINIINNPNDLTSLKRIINIPAKWLWKKAVEEIVNVIKSNEWNIHKVILEPHLLNKSLSKKAYEWFSLFANMMQTIIKKGESMIITDFMKELISITNYKWYLEENYKWDELEDKLANIQELVSMAEFYNYLPWYDWIIEFWEKIALMTDINEYKNDNEDFVSLMTIHKSKWLEFENVVLPAVESWIIPSKKSLETLLGVEEERRLMYVAITRAKKNLYITYSDYRVIFWKGVNQYSSPFINEIPHSLKKEIGNYI